MEATTVLTSPEMKRAAQRLTKMLEAECRLHAAHAELLVVERGAITAGKGEEVAAITSKREEITDRLAVAARERDELVKTLHLKPGTKLGQWAEESLTKEEREPLLLAIAELKSLAATCRREVSIFGQLTQFALNLVNGTLSILWSANQNEVKSYSAQGKMQKSYQPATTRAAGLLKRA